MKPIKTRYGAAVHTKIVLDDEGLIDATFYVGQVGETPVIEKSFPFVDGVAFITLAPEDTRIPLSSDTINYKYQINVAYENGDIDKYPDPEECDDDGDLPEFIVVEALDETEVA